MGIKTLNHEPTALHTLHKHRIACEATVWNKFKTFYNLKNLKSREKLGKR